MPPSEGQSSRWRPLHVTWQTEAPARRYVPTIGELMASSPLWLRIIEFVGIGLAVLGTIADAVGLSANAPQPYALAACGLVTVILALALIATHFVTTPSTSKEWWLAILGTGSVVALVVASGIFGQLIMPSRAAATPPVPGASDEEPVVSIAAFDPPSPEVITVSGAVKDLPPGDTLWVFVSREDPFQFLQDGPCVIYREENRWSCTGVHLGVADSSGTFKVSVARADSGATRRLVDLQSEAKSTGKWQEFLETRGYPFNVEPSTPVEAVRQ